MEALALELAFADLATFSALASAALAALALDSLVVDLVDLVFNALAEGKLPALAALGSLGGDVAFTALAEYDPCFSALASALLKMAASCLTDIDVRDVK